MCVPPAATSGSLDGAVPGAEVLPAARGLLVEGFQLNLCNADLRLFSPEGFRHMVEDSAWLTRGVDDLRNAFG